MTTFSEFPLHPKILQALAARGFTTPTEIQAQVIPLLLSKPDSDIHAQAQTGTGKTLAFGLPLLQSIDTTQKHVQGLVVAPTRELVMQIYDHLKAVSADTGIILEPIYGGMPIERQMANLRRGAHIIIGTPGRLNDHLRRRTLKLDKLKIFVLDEADIMLDMGFRDEIDEIFAHTPSNRRIWLFSATVMAGIKQLIKSHMKNVLTAKAEQSGGASEQVKQYFCVVPTRRRTEAAIRFIESAPDFYGIIFCQTKTLTTDVTRELSSRGFKVDCLHGDMKQNLRNRVIKGFKDRAFNILVATNVAARGIDVSGLTHVISFSIPEEHEYYIHRIGRTGRAGKEGIAIVFVTPSELSRVGRLEREAKTALEEIAVPELKNIIQTKMTAVSDFIEQSKKPLKKLTQVHQALNELLSSFSQQEISQALAIALEERFFKDMVHDNFGTLRADGAHPSIQPLRGHSGRADTGRGFDGVEEAAREICLELGLDTGFNRDSMLAHVCQTCGIAPADVFKVRVLNRKTFIVVPDEQVDACLQALKQKQISGRVPRAYIIRPNFQATRPPERRRMRRRR